MLEFPVDFEIMIFNVKHVFAPLSPNTELLIITSIARADDSYAWIMQAQLIAQHE